MPFLGLDQTDLFHQGVGDGHSRELSATSVCSLFTMSTQSGDLAEIEVESFSEPVDGITGFVGEDLDEVVSGEFSRRFLGIGKAGRQWGLRGTRHVVTDNLAAVSGIPRSWNFQCYSAGSVIWTYGLTLKISATLTT
jgi:hypothetical protein